ITRRIIRDFEGDPGKNVSEYSKTDSPQYNRMVAEIASRLNLDSLKYSKIESIVSAIGLDKCRLCTHCFDGSSAFTLEEENK
ncbi:MAG: amidophosphoribosyltransferase, partial [Candidatus Cryptobacteroides sp.]